MARKQSAKTLNLDRGTLRYIQEVQKYPLLDAATEHECALRWRDHQDEQALQQLVNSHLRLVVKVAMQYRHYPIAVEELISEGSVGLMQAAASPPEQMPGDRQRSLQFRAWLDEQATLAAETVRWSALPD